MFVNHRISDKTIRQIWADEKTPLRAAAKEIGMSFRAVQSRAVKLGLPARKTGGKQIDLEGMEEMWAFGLPAKEIGRHYRVHWQTVYNAAKRAGLPKRGRGCAKRITLEEWRQAQVILRLAQTAAREQATAIQRRVVDSKPQSNVPVGYYHARNLSGGRT
jgi:hypothetical protein